MTKANRHMIKDYPKEYSSWRKMRDRCRDESHLAYHKYGGRGVVVEDCLYDSFDTFMDNIGPMPNDGVKYTLDRVDNSLGYVVGNIRWLSARNQNQNKGITRTNTSGVKGVYFEKDKKCWTAEIRTNTGSKLRRRFSVAKFTDELAFLIACEQRHQWELILNQMGCTYQITQKF